MRPVLFRAALRFWLAAASQAYGTITVTSPGSTNVITPPHMHINCEVSSSVGISPSSTVGAPGTHGVPLPVCTASA